MNYLPAAPAAAVMKGYCTQSADKYTSANGCVLLEYTMRKQAVDHWPLLSPASRVECAQFGTYESIDVCAQSHLREDQR
jgi:hypothetical protein